MYGSQVSCSPLFSPRRAQQFNQKSPAEHKVAFVVAQVLELPSRQGPARWASLEPLLAGEYK
jgi:hypothetical protein